MFSVWMVLALLPILGGAERFNCRGRILGAYYADAKSGCKAFHVCVRVAGGGIRDFRFFCPPGTLFHQEAQTCTDWGDDDPLACPADLYDGQFDLYKIGSGYDTKKLSSQGTRDEEAEFGLQRAETGDRRLAQNNKNNGPASDLRADHSSDFFSGQRDRGRDDSSPAAPTPAHPTPQSSSRQSFRRIATPRTTTTTTTQYTTALPPQQSNSPQYDAPSKRKLVRKRPIYQSTLAPTAFENNIPQKPFPPKQNNPPQKYQNPFPPKQNNPSQQFSQQTQQPFVQQSSQNVPQNNFQQQPQQNFNNRVPAQIRQTSTTTLEPPANVPPQYKDEYVEVVRVAPKQPKNRYHPHNTTPAPHLQNFNKKDGLVELYNYDGQSTPSFNVQNDLRPFKVRNSFNVQDSPREDFVRINTNNVRNTSTTADYISSSTRGFGTGAAAYKNVNSVSYDSEKNNFISANKQNYYNVPTTTPTTTIYTTPANLNTIAYNTNFALNTFQPANYGNSDEDDGQYRPLVGEDDGQYRPELYDRDQYEKELLSGAHSINIAASGNKLSEEQKAYVKSQQYQKPVSQTSAPRPFRPAPTPTTRTPEPTYTTTYRPTTTLNTQRTFDYFQTYTTTSRPTGPPAPVPDNLPPVNAAPAPRPSSPPAPRPSSPPAPRPTSPPAPRPADPRPASRAPAPPTVAPLRPSTRSPLHANSPNKQEDSSYDYAYYDSDNGFSEYDHIEEFGRTKTRA